MAFHLETMVWLQTLELEEYGTLFMQYPYVEVSNKELAPGGHSHIMELLMLVNQPQKWTLNGVIGKG